MHPPLSLYLLCISFIYSSVGDKFGGLYPRESVSREVRSLDGIWDFRVAPTDDPDVGFRERWYEQPLRLTGETIRMPVPSSYNDITQSKELRDHVGWAWYDREFYVPRRWVEDKLRIVLRFGSAHYYSIVYVNGIEAIQHEVGHLPFSADISDLVDVEKANLVTISINNTLTPLTIPQGSIVYKNDITSYPEGYFIQQYDFDFFNYAGIHRPVFLYTTPQTYVDDITVLVNISGDAGVVSYNLTVESPLSASEINCSAQIMDKSGTVVSELSECSGQMTVSEAQFWWPYLMSEEPGYLYTLQVSVSDSDGRFDTYPQKFGIRTIGWNSTTVTLNGVPLYLRGFGKHEDAHIIGKGVHNALIVKDFNLMKWLGANSFRTSHYPYAEEIMDMADEEGIMVIDESPGGDLTGFGDELLAKHKTVMEAMIYRDKNRPSVIMWSVANEPNSDQLNADNYFQELADFVRQQDPRRPVTAAVNKIISEDYAAKSLDVLLLNKYYSWYTDTGHPELIQRQMTTELNEWFAYYNKPIMISEYGADAIPGLHMDPAFTWSEEYQVELMYENFEAFDSLRNEGYFFGEMIWNFADFATPQDTGRVAGNKKGIFTRSRQPKASAHVLRERYHQLANKTLSKKNFWRQVYL